MASLRFHLGGVLTGLGVGLFIVARAANRYHSQKFNQHTTRLQQLADEGRDQAIREEVQRFSEDHSVDLAITLLSWSELLWFPCLAFGLALLYSEWPT